MHTTRLSTTPLLIALALASLAVALTVRAAEAPAHDHDHTPTATQPAPAETPPMDAMLKMRAMHEKWMTAKTPAERQTLIAEHMQVMQEGMKAMQRMSQGTDHQATSGIMMQQRMDMMTMMMQMMVDRQCANTPPVAPSK